MGLLIKKDISPAQKEEVSLFYWRIENCFFYIILKTCETPIFNENRRAGWACLHVVTETLEK